MINFVPAAKAMLGRNTPVYVHYGITHRCNLTCAMCGLWKLGKKEEELSTDQIRDLASNLKALGTMAISLGGGEPFIRQDLPEIVKAFIDRGIETRVLTNGLAGSAELRKKTADTGIRHISISLDTPSPEVQSEICHKPQIWNDIVDSIIYWSKIINKRSGTGLINCVVSQKSLADIPKMAKIAEYTGFKLSLVPIETHRYKEERLTFSQEASQMKFSSEEDLSRLDELGAYLQDLKKKSPDILFNSAPYLEGMINFLKYHCSQNENIQTVPKYTFFKDCQTGGLSFSISPDGRYSMCHLYDDSAEHNEEAPLVCSRSFVPWYKQRSLSVIKQHREGCRSCFRPCWWEIALSFSSPQAFFNAAKLRFIPDKEKKNFISSNQIADLLTD